jgi:uncharacterized protein (DUF488 family)
MALFSIGHSTYSEADFLGSISGKISTVIDVRSHPESRWPQYERLQLHEWLPKAGIGYEWWPELGGWDRRHEHLANEFEPKGVDLHVYAKGKFPKQRIGKKFPDAVESSQLALPHIRPKWTNVGLYDYSYFMMLEEFLEGADRLIERGKTEDLGFMCCEALWYRCHRSLICDYLTFRGVESFHLTPHWRQKNKVKFVDGFRTAPHSKYLGNRLERYEPEIIDRWNSWGSESSPVAGVTTG